MMDQAVVVWLHMPCETAMGSGGMRWWVQTKGTEMAGELCICKHEVLDFGLKTQN